MGHGEQAGRRGQEEDQAECVELEPVREFEPVGELEPEWIAEAVVGRQFIGIEGIEPAQRRAVMKLPRSRRGREALDQARAGKAERDRRRMGTTARDVAAEQGLPDTAARDFERERVMPRPKGPSRSE